MLTIAKGRLNIEGRYDGTIWVRLKKAFFAPDIFVEFESDKYLPDGHPCEDGIFAKGVLFFLEAEGLLEAGHEYALSRAEFGMQGASSIAYETLYRDEKEINHEFYAKFDTCDLSAEDAEKARLHKIEMNNLMTPEMHKLVKDRQQIFLNYVQQLSEALKSTYAHFSGEFQMHKHEVLGSEWQKMENKDLKRHIEFLFLHDIGEKVNFNSFDNTTWGFYITDDKEDCEDFFEDF